MKRLFALLFLSAAAVAGCNSSTGDDDGGVSQNTYFPLRTGETWTYAHLDSTGATTSTETCTVTDSTTVIDGETYRVLSRTYSTSDYVGSYLLRAEGDIVYSTNPFIIYKRAKTANHLDGEFSIYKFGISSGTSWIICEPDTGGYGELRTGEYMGTATTTANGIEYEDCAKYHFTMTWPNSPSYDVAEDIWLAPNIGVVKQVTTTTSTYTPENSQTPVTQIETATCVLTSHTSGTN